MQFATLNATYRAGTGKSVTRKLRATGRIPAVCYGAGHDPLALAVSSDELLKALDPEKRSNTVFSMKVGGEGGKPQELTTMLRAWQRDPLRGDLVHADFVRVALDKDVHATVPLVIVGKSKGIALGGILHQVFRSLEVACTPDKIPTKIEVNVENLGMGDALHVRELPLGAGVRALVDASLTVCTVTAPKAEKAATAEGEAAAAEGAAAPAAEAKPAAGAKADAKPAAGKAEAKPAAGKAEAKPAAKK